MIGANPLVKIGECSLPVHSSTTILSYFSRILFERAIPQYPLLYGFPSPIFFQKGITFTHPFFVCLK